MSNLLQKRSRLSILVLIIVAVSNLTAAGQSAGENTDSLQVAKTMKNFIVVFSNLQWDDFINYFSDDATVFFPPSAQYSFRATGKNEIEKVFKPFFEKIKKQKDSPPYLNIDPKNLLIQIVDSVAVVTFTLEDPNLLGRRTFVLRRQDNRWVIIHLHASGVPLAK